MSKKLTYLLVWILATSSVFAAPITKEQAQKKAAAFAVQKGRELSSRKSSVHRAPRAKGQDDSPYYVFDMAADGGFVIVSGDDRTRSIIGYTECGNYDENSLPDNMKSWLQMVSDRITSLSDAPLVPTGRTQLKAPAQGVPGATPVIGPLLASTWNQGTPYWDNCPFRNGRRCYTGCTATAFAQVMYFYRWPEGATTSVPGYTDDGLNYSTLPATTFDWNAMKNSYSDSDSGTNSGNAVAKLMHYMGKGALMHYTDGGSGAAFVNAINALKNYFGYPNDIYEIHKDNYSSNEWVNAVYAELYYGRPVLIEGYSDVNWGGGHAFVCDGYRDDGCFHINWGWGGWCDGYFSLDVLNPDDHSGMGAAPGGNGYYWHEGAVMNVRRPDGGSGLMTTDRGVATFYQDANYGGYGYSLPEGVYTLSQLRAYGIQNDDISSLKVLPGFKVTLYNDDNFGGTSHVFTADAGYVGNDWNDKASSIRIETNGVTGKTGVYKLQNRNSNKFMDLNGNSTADNTAVVQWDDEGTEEYQHWFVKEVQAGVYTIQASAAISKGLDVAGGSVNNSTQVLLYPYGGGTHQQFILVDKGNDYYTLVARHCGKVVEIPGASTGSGEWLKTWENNGTACQQWKLIAVTGEIGTQPVVTLYQDINYGGYAVQLPEGTYTQAQLEAHGVRNNDITSLRVQAGYKVTIYDGSSFNNDSKTFTADASYVGNDWNDRTSSVRIEPNIQYVTVDLTDNGGSYAVSHTPVNNNESGAKLFDNTSSTKYCTFINSSDAVTMTYNSTQSARLTSYTITSGNDFDGRDPKNWRLEGSNNGSSWTTIDTRSNETFASRFQKNTYNVTTSQEFSQYRLVVTGRKDANATVFQIAELELFGLVAQIPMAFAPESAAEDATGIEETPAADAATFDIYTINGTRVRRNATGTAGLPRGIYVIKGRKVLVR
ncbi:MAG: C10 family peptidase [Bacteroidaceae bacterium]|nr:C10 family peptidase [Bacteroidaceae bacterium]